MKIVIEVEIEDLQVRHLSTVAHLLDVARGAADAEAERMLAEKEVTGAELIKALTACGYNQKMQEIVSSHQRKVYDLIDAHLYAATILAHVDRAVYTARGGE